MKVCLSLLFLFCSSVAMAKPRILQFNHDVFRCSNEYKFIFEVEKSGGVYQVDAEGIEIANLDFQQSLGTTVNELGVFSPARALFLKELAASNNTKIQYRKKVQIARNSPSANIILPEGCTVEVISSTSFDEDRNYNIVINKDIYDALSIEGKITFFFTLSLDIQQVFTSHSWWKIDDIEINLFQSREFLACWYNKSCRPTTLAGFHVLSQKSIYNFKFIEQDHILISANHLKNVVNPKTGLIQSADYPIIDLHPSTPAFRSYFIFRNEKILFNRSLGSSRVAFDEEGNLNCVPILHNIRLTKINEGNLISLFDACWNKEDEIVSTGLFFGPQTEFKDYVASIENQKVAVRDISSIHMYDNEKLNWISNARGLFKLNNQEILLDGMLKLYPSGKPQCFQLGKETTLKLPNGQKLEMAINPQWKNTDLYCFKEDGNFLQSYKTYFYEAIGKIF